jgi:uncharacterized membrane protein YuzA (DUF378 family)
MNGLLHDRLVQMMLGIIVSIGAVNWATIEFFETDLLLDVIGLESGSGELTIIYAVIGAAAVIRLLSVVDWGTGGAITGMNKSEME